MRRAADCIEGGYFRESRLGGHRCFYRLGLGLWVNTIERLLRCVARLTESREATLGRVLRCVARMTASREATLGNRVSEGVVAFTVWGLGGGCIKLRWS